MRRTARDRSTTAAERLRQAFDMHQTGVAMTRLSLARRFGAEEAEQRLRDWLMDADGEMPGFEPATLRRRAAEAAKRPPNLARTLGGALARVSCE